MMFEVELKFAVGRLPEIDRRLTELGASPPVEQLQCDAYYHHPARDFAATDEALRIRTCGADNRLTYKGPKIDPLAKTRREIELPLAAGDDSRAQWGEMLAALGFRLVARVEKTRLERRLTWRGVEVAAALDEVVGLGSFVELEAAAATPADAAEVRDRLLELAAELGLATGERRSYLELLLLAGEPPDSANQAV